ncbi:hypothetical protein niasHT_007208 [Heterodera trifolii]|uniref:ZP domain-containing protein n=1 Tax=Heterodera trifolii TaxID=157864 RepID=A0ABD2LL01_9BILA
MFFITNIWLYHSSPIVSFPFLALFLQNIPAKCNLFSSVTAPSLSDVIDQKVSVVVDPIRVIFDNSSDFGGTKSFSNDFSSLCALSLHRSANCEGQQIKPSESIGWDTRICFRWHCEGIGPGMAMRVENCWTGSERNPIELIDDGGCSREETMISSPIHRHVQRTALSLGWLTVRLFNTHKIRLSCAIRLCHSCKKQCTKKIVPNCKWKTNEEEKRRREAMKELEEMCREERRRREQPTAEQKINAGKRTEETLIRGMTMLAITWALLDKMTKALVRDG